MNGFRILGGGSLALSLDLRCTRKSALDLPPGKLRSDPPSFGCSADDNPWWSVMGSLIAAPVLWLVRPIRGPGAMRGVPQSGLWSEEAIASSGTGSERAPASGGPFPQIPAFEGRCIPAGFVALPQRTALGTPRLGASPDGAHRPSRCTASSATDPRRPGRERSGVESLASQGPSREEHDLLLGKLRPGGATRVAGAARFPTLEAGH